MNARLYDPVVRRFLNPDPYIQMPDNTQNYNRYAYCLNNPLMYTDRSGESFFVVFNFVSDILKNIVRTFKHGIKAWTDGHAWKKTRQAAKIWTGLFKGGFKRFVSRFTWELPQNILGYLAGQTLNSLNKIEYVGYYGGATVVSTSKGTWGAFTLGSFITAAKGVRADPADKIFQHEYGHYLQSQKFGLLYIPRIAVPSFFSAMGNGHMLSCVEQDASWRGLNYFYHNVSGFDKWDFENNPIGEFNMDRDYDYEQVLLKSGSAKINWFKN